MDGTNEDPALGDMPGPCSGHRASSPPSTADGEVAALFRRWLDLSELNRRVFVALTHEVDASSDLVEHGVIDLITCFQLLAATTSGQARRIDEAIALVDANPADARAGAIAEALADVHAKSVAITQAVTRMVTCVQFQDRVKQHLDHISDTLTLLGSAAAALRDSTQEQVGTLGWDGGMDEAWKQRILAGQTLGAVRERFMHRLFSTDPARRQPPAAAPAGEGEIDLF